jgi:rod shape-determining protein MreD
MGIFLGFVLLWLVAILKSTLMPHLRLEGGAPDLMLMMVISWALLATYSEAFLWAVIGGVSQDLLSGVPTGSSALALLLVALLASLLQTQLYRSNVLIVLLMTLVGSLVFQLVMMLVLALSGYRVDWIYNIVYIVTPTTILNLLLIIPIFRVMQVLYERLNPRIETL